MPSTINATTSGIVTTGDSVATLSLQTGGNTAVAIDTSQNVTLAKSLIISGSTSGNVTFTANAISGTQSYTLPPALPASSGYALTSTTGGVMTWAASGGGTPGGTDTQVQFNDGGSTFGGDSGLTYNKTTDNLTVLGNLVIGTSGKGIDFSATPGTGTSELLADYEEGTFSPSIDSATAGSGRATTVNGAVYTKTGRLVSFSCWLTLSTLGTGGSGAFYIKNLPFTAASFSQPIYIGVLNGLASSLSTASGYVITATTNIVLTGCATPSTTPYGDLTFATYAAGGMQIICSGSYITT